jgi:RNA polymerase sporulation-specific sigma factor
MYFRSTKKYSYEVSLDEPIDQDGDGNSLALMDILSTTDSSLESVEQNDCYRVIRQTLHLLEPREKEIIILRYGLTGQPPLTQREVAKKYNISRSYVSRIEKRALKKLRGQLDTD